MRNTVSAKIAHFMAFVIVASVSVVPAAVNGFNSHADQVQYGDALYVTGLQQSLHQSAVAK